MVKGVASETNRPRRSNRVSLQQPIQDQPRAKWTLYLTKILADLMVEQVHKGNRQNNSFAKKAWQDMCDEFQRKTGLNWDKEQLKNRFGIMRRQYTTVKSLLETNDFSWDESLRMVKAKGEQVWDEYIKAHPDAEAIRTNGCPYYKQLCVIFGNEIFYQFNHPVNIDPNTADMPIDFGTPPSLFVKDELSPNTQEDENIPNERSTKCQSVTPPKRNTTGIEDIMARAISEIAAASKLRISAVAHSVERFSIANCVKALDEIQGVDDCIYYAALDLFDKPNARETFMSLKAEKRFVWLKGKCNAPSRSIA